MDSSLETFEIGQDKAQQQKPILQQRLQAILKEQIRHAVVQFPCLWLCYLSVINKISSKITRTNYQFLMTNNKNYLNDDLS